MGDAALFACGGGASRVVRENPLPSMPVVVLNPEPPAAGAGEGFDELAHAVARAAADAAWDSFASCRIAFVYAILGGDMGAVLMSEATRRAREAGCRVVAVAGIPWENADRRERAMALLPKVMGESDRTLVSDGLAVVRLLDGEGLSLDDVLRAHGAVMSAALDSLAQIAEGPFFSTLPERAYTYSYVTDPDPVRAVERAMGATAFPTDPSYGKMAVTVSSSFGLARVEEITEAVASRTGIIPEVFKRGDSDDGKVLVFLPLRTSPTASRA